jgi:hypothetical protein
MTSPVVTSRCADCVLGTYTADIANIMASKLSVDKLERTARAMLAIVAKRKENRKTAPGANVVATPRPAQTS